MAFLPFWIAGWTLGGLVALRRLIHGYGDQIFLVIWLGVWLVGEVLATSEWLWTVFGYEVLNIRGGYVRVRRTLFERGFREKSFLLHDLSNLRAAGDFGSKFPPGHIHGVWSFTGGNVAVDHGTETHRFGVDLEEQDARELVEALKGYLS
jgi:hypothetical protein